MHSKSDAPTLPYSGTPFHSSDRKAFLWSISSLVILAWLILWVWGQTPYGRYLEHGGLGEIGHSGGAGSVLLSVILYIAGWTLMTVAMMLPTTLPLLEIFRRLTRRKPKRLRLVA